MDVMNDQQNMKKEETEMTDKVQTDSQGVFREDAGGKSSTGLDHNLAGLLAYAFGFVSGILLFVLEKDSKFVKYHALQSIFIWLGLFVVSMVVGFIPLIGWLISLLIAPVGFIIWIYCMVKAYQGSWFKFPVAGNIAMQQVADMDK